VRIEVLKKPSLLNNEGLTLFLNLAYVMTGKVILDI